MQTFNPDNTNSPKGINKNIMSAGKYVQCYIHLVFAVKNREALLTKDIRNRVFEYISGIIRGMNHKSIIVNGVSDHIHILLGVHQLAEIYWYDELIL